MPQINNVCKYYQMYLHKEMLKKTLAVQMFKLMSYSIYSFFSSKKQTCIFSGFTLLVKRRKLQQIGLNVIQNISVLAALRANIGFILLVRGGG